MKHAAFLLVAAFLLPAAFGQDDAAAPARSRWETISPEELKPGMKGYGLTVLKGDKLERFEVEVIGVLYNIAPKRDGILVRLAGLDLESSGVIAGMSGSPVIIEGRLAGAVAFGWGWPKEPICGVTPIGEMEEALAADTELGASSPSWETFGTVRMLGGPAEPRKAAGLQEAADESFSLQNIAVPVVIPPLPPAARRFAGEVFAPERVVFAEGVAGAPAEGAPEGDAVLVPGSSVFGALVTGDMIVGGVGTVTDVRGDEVYAFGHPFLEREGVSMPMYTSTVHTVFPSPQRSFKLASPDREVGAFVRDRATGVLGVLGEKAAMVPMKVTVLSRGKTTTFNYRITKHHTITPQMAATAAASSVTAMGSLSSEVTIAYGFDVSFDGGHRLAFDWKAGGQQALSAVASDVAAGLSMMMFNPLENLDPSSIEVTVEIENENATAVIESVEVRENEVWPGETLHATVTLRPVLEEPETVAVEITVPPDTPAGRRALIVCDGRTSEMLDRQELRHRMNPRSVEDIIRFATPKRGPGELVARLAATDYGIAIEGTELPRLPSSTLAMLAAPQESGLSPVIESRATSVKTAYVLTGKTVIPVNVKSPAEEK